MRLLLAVPVFVDINIGKKVTLNSRMYLKMSLFHQKRMKIICDNNMCSIWFTFHIYIIRSGVCVNLHYYIISASLHSFYASFYPRKRETCFTHGHIDKKVWHNIH